MSRTFLRQALLAAAVALAFPGFAAAAPDDAAPKKPAKTATAKADKAKPAGKASAKTSAKADGKSGKAGKKATAKAEPVEKGPGPLADFGDAKPSDDVAHVANWVSYTRNNRAKNFVIIDKKNTHMYVFDAKGKLKSHSVVLIGSAIGDHTDPGVGNKPLSQLKPEEKTTAAGRFLAQRGRNSHGEDILWIDYNSALSMHRLRKVGNEQRAERLASPEIEDNRISNGCVNVPHAFYNKVLSPAVPKGGAYVYVLPETTTPQQLFRSFDVPKPT